MKLLYLPCNCQWSWENKVAQRKYYASQENRRTSWQHAQSGFRILDRVSQGCCRWSNKHERQCAMKLKALRETQNKAPGFWARLLWSPCTKPFVATKGVRMFVAKASTQVRFSADNPSLNQSRHCTAMLNVENNTLASWAVCWKISWLLVHDAVPTWENEQLLTLDVSCCSTQQKDTKRGHPQVGTGERENYAACHLGTGSFPTSNSGQATVKHRPWHFWTGDSQQARTSVRPSHATELSSAPWSRWRHEGPWTCNSFWDGVDLHWHQRNHIFHTKALVYSMRWLKCPIHHIFPLSLQEAAPVPWKIWKEIITSPQRPAFWGCALPAQPTKDLLFIDVIPERLQHLPDFVRLFFPDLQTREVSHASMHVLDIEDGKLASKKLQISWLTAIKC